MQKYKDEYSKRYSCIVKSSKSDEHTFCTICSADISISHILAYFGALSPFFKLCRLSSLEKLFAVIYVMTETTLTTVLHYRADCDDQLRTV